MLNIFMNKRYPSTPFYFVSLWPFAEPPRKTIRMRVYILIGRVIPKIVPYKEIP